MASTRTKRTIGASPLLNYNDEKFTSPEHEKWFETKIVEKKVVPERAIALGEGAHPEMQQEVERRGWQQFASLVGQGDQDLMREFYANAKQFSKVEGNQKYVTFVRGVYLSYSPTHINNLLGIQWTERGSGHQRHCNPKRDIAQIVQLLCKEGTTWEEEVEDRSPKQVHASSLRPLPKAWNKFVISHLAPVFHTTYVLVNRLGLIYSIMRGWSINVGAIIAKEIHDIAQNKQASLGFPSIIMKLCLHNNVPMSGTLVRIRPKPPITNSMVETFQAAFNGLPQAHPPPAPAASRRQHNLHMSQRMERVERSIDRLAAGVVNIDGMVRAIGTHLHIDDPSFATTPLTMDQIFSPLNFAGPNDEAGAFMEAEDAEPFDDMQEDDQQD